MMERSATRSPMARPARPRASSPTSAFFFCGMSDEPVAKASSSVMNPNSFVVQRTISSPSAGEVDRRERDREEQLDGAVAVRHGVERVLRDAAEAERLRDPLAVERERGAGERAGAERRDRRAAPDLGEPLAVAPERLDVGEQVVRERHRLRALQVGVAGEDASPRARARACTQSARWSRRERGVDAVAGADDEEPLVERHLVVAAAAGVEVAGVPADQLAEPPLDVGVHVLERRVEGDLAGGELARARWSSAATIRFATAAGTIPCLASMETWAWLPRMSSA